uniref:Uncharacterized protein n=1 Tax=Branchiostoma floridae TaxID=7739 RepID=C3YXQ4_BRAFL|eukprot:XP_002598851.1 hypothetical protein BRAFLDRAFT_74472 [Branchiostoma floridae]
MPSVSHTQSESLLTSRVLCADCLKKWLTGDPTSHPSVFKPDVGCRAPPGDAAAGPGLPIGFSVQRLMNVPAYNHYGNWIPRQVLASLFSSAALDKVQGLIEAALTWDGYANCCTSSGKTSQSLPQRRRCTHNSFAAAFGERTAETMGEARYTWLSLEPFGGKFTGLLDRIDVCIS